MVKRHSYIKSTHELDPIDYILKSKNEQRLKRIKDIKQLPTENLHNLKKSGLISRETIDIINIELKIRDKKKTKNNSKYMIRRNPK